MIKTRCWIPNAYIRDITVFKMYVSLCSYCTVRILISKTYCTVRILISKTYCTIRILISKTYCTIRILISKTLAGTCEGNVKTQKH